MNPMTTLNNNNNTLVIKHSFATVGRTLSHNYKSATGNTTITGTVVNHGNINSRNIYDNSISYIREGVGIGCRGTLCFSKVEDANEYMTLVNDALKTHNVVYVEVNISNNQTIFNNKAGEPKSLTIFNIYYCSIAKVELNSNVVSSIGSNLTTGAPLSPAIEKARKDYEELVRAQSNKVNVSPSDPSLPVVPVVPVEVSAPPLPQVESARNSLSFLTQEQLDSLLSDGITEEELADYSEAELKELVSLG